AAGVLGQIIGEGNSRLYWALVDDGLCDEASFEHSAEDGLGTFYGSLSCAPHDLETALERYRNVLETVSRDAVTREELGRAKKRLEVSLALRFETPHSRLTSLAEDFIALSAYRSVPDLLEEVRGVTLDGVNAVLEAKPFETLSVTTLTPA
ncbi:MAG: insulinase family protein, partial [Pleurocapsa sp. SU_196_0]|nr:insulinase family protein [Pleurocapsa sp. SU_196_0]